MTHELLYKHYYTVFTREITKRVKIFYISQHNEKRQFNKVHGEITLYISTEVGKSLLILCSDDLQELYRVFAQRKDEYFEDEVNRIIEYHIKPKFVNLDKSSLPTSFTLTKLIKQLAFLDVKKEIGRILHNYSNFFEQFYHFIEYEKFIIIDESSASPENSEIYKEFHKRRYPHIYKSSLNIEFKEDEKDIEKKLTTCQATLLIEMLITRGDKWVDATENRKAIIISKITGLSKRNITKFLADSANKQSTWGKQFIKDYETANDLIFTLGG